MPSLRLSFINDFMNKKQNLPRTLANRLLTLAQLDPENEICGLISLKGENDYQVYPIENIAEDRQCRFEMQPQQQIDALRNIRETEAELFAIFHSHPHSAARPSKMDMDEAAYDDALNIIISLDTRGVLDMRGYYYHQQQALPVDLVID